MPKPPILRNVATAKALAQRFCLRPRAASEAPIRQAAAFHRRTAVPNQALIRHLDCAPNRGQT